MSGGFTLRREGIGLDRDASVGGALGVRQVEHQVAGHA